MAFEQFKLTVTISEVTGSFTPKTGLTTGQFTFKKTVDNSAVSFSGFTEIGDGQYEFSGFNVPDAIGGSTTTGYSGVTLVDMYIGGTIQNGFRRIPVMNNTNEFVASSDIACRIDRWGDTIHGMITIDTTNFTGSYTTPSDYNLIHKKWAVDNFITGSTVIPSGSFGNYVTLSGSAQSISSLKTFTGGTIFNTTGATFIIKNDTWSSGLTVDSNLNFTFSSGSSIISNNSASFYNPVISTSSPKYTSPDGNSLICKTWVQNHFEPLGSSIASNTVIVDPAATELIGVRYNTIMSAMNSIYPSATSTNIYTILVYQYDDTFGYSENIVSYDYVNIIGMGKISIAGTFTRSGTSGYPKIQNLHLSSDGSHTLTRLDITDSIFNSISDTVDIGLSKLNNVGLFAGSSMSSSGNNKIINCYGNYDIAWNATTDKVFGYDVQIGTTFEIE